MNLKSEAGFRRLPTLFSIFSGIFLALLLSLTAFLGGLSAAPAREEGVTQDSSENPDRNTFGLYLENDYFAGTDSGYSSGLKLSWSSAVQDQYPENAFPHFLLYPLIRLFPFEQTPDRRRNITFALGQNIYTPEDIESEDVVEDDRPYAGISYVAMGFHSRESRQIDSLELTLGIVGPGSYAEECQKAVHRVFDDVQPMGWDNQLSNEPVIGLGYEYKKRITPREVTGGFGHAAIFNTGGVLGNAMTYYNMGLMLRIGWNLPNDFGIFSIRPISSINGAVVHSGSGPASAFGVHLFGSMEGRAVLRNIFLDGNTFTDSHSVDKKPMVGDLMAGINVTFGQGQLSFAYVTRSKEFETQHKTQKFASINLSYAY